LLVHIYFLWCCLTIVLFQNIYGHRGRRRFPVFEVEPVGYFFNKRVLAEPELPVFDVPNYSDF
jgi:hypothetical protein